MSDFVERFNRRGDAVREAYTNPESKITRPFEGCNVLVDILADVFHRASVAGQDTDALWNKALTIHQYEWGFVGEQLVEDNRRRQAERAAVRAA